MKLTEINNGMTVSNYKEMCRLLNEQEKNGCSKKAQLREWERHFEYTKSGQKFIIGKIYDSPLPKQPRKDNVYVTLIETLLLAFLSTQSDLSVHIKYDDLFEKLNMVSPNYKRLKEKKTYEAVMQYHGENGEDNVLSKESYYDFKLRTKSKMREILNNSLKSLERRKLISEHQKELVIVFEDGKDKNGNPIYSKHIASAQEASYVLHAEREALVDMGMDEIYEVFKDGCYEEYYELVTEKLKEIDPSWRYTYRQLYLCCYPADAKAAIEQTKQKLRRYAREENLILNENKLNAAIVSVLNTQAQKKLQGYNDDINIRWWGKPSRKFDKDGNPITRAESLPNYLQDQRYLTDFFIANEKEAN